MYFSKAEEWGWLHRALPRPKKLRESAGRIIALTNEQCDALMRAAIAGADPRLLGLPHFRLEYDDAA